MFTFSYPAKFNMGADGRFLVSFPDFPSAHTDGASRQEAMTEAMDCLGSVIAFAMADSGEVPKPSAQKRGQSLVPVPFWIVGKLALLWAIRDAGITQSEMARRLAVRETVVRRMLDPHHTTRTEKLAAALELLGKRMVVAFQDAA